jgi:hypothetical protein
VDSACAWTDPNALISYSGDDLGGAEWDGRDWRGQWSVREKLAMLSAELALKL